MLFFAASFIATSDRSPICGKTFQFMIHVESQKQRARAEDDTVDCPETTHLWIG